VGAHLDATKCRAVWTGQDFAPLACLKSASLFGKSDEGAVALVSQELLGAHASQLPAVVDHRAEGTEGPVRDQGTAPACTAFATAAALDHAVARWTGKVPHVSVMQIWSRYHTPLESRSIETNLGLGVGAEDAWPFKAPEAVAWVDCASFDKPPRGGCGKAVDEARAKQLDARAIAAFTRVEYLPSFDVAIVRERLAAGQDVVVAMDVPDALVPKGRAGARYVPNYTKVAPDAGHAVVVAGYANLPHGTYFLVHNSWGAAWGDGGYAWMHEATLRSWAHEFLVIDAEPTVRDATQRPARARGETTCADPLVPDSLRGTCAPECPDHSPRHDGVCAIAGQCPAGFVNLTGACVLAAPTATGNDPSTHIAWTCGPGGCAYVVPRAVDGACTGAVCRVSCPAPDFRLARAGASLTCVE
jgi:hypothetical protein